MISTVTNRIFSCDWGTSNFRLRLIDTDTADVIDEITSGEGISSVFNLWGSSGTDRQKFYAAVLQKYIAILQVRVDQSLEDLPVVISGMASSTLGITELPYAVLPFNADGGSVEHSRINIDGFSHEIFLISGVRSENDVMRGEETQWIGLMHHYHLPGDAGLLFIMPGTHSKHIFVKGREIINFKTYMTGEFFNLLSTLSVLKNSVTIQHSPKDTGNRSAFISGVKASSSPNLLHESFMVRTNELFGRFNKKENASFLSGLLIGTEVRQSEKYKTILAAGETLCEPYQLALENSGTTIDLTICSPAELDKAVILGQLTIFKKITGAR